MTSLRRRQFILAAVAAGLAPRLLRASHLDAEVEKDEGLLGVCLGSGALHGYAHIGAIRAFEHLGLKPDIITGTSVGAIVGALWAAGFSADEIETLSSDRRWRESSGLRLPDLGIGRLDGLSELIERQLAGRPIEALPTRFAALATDIDSGLPVILDHGPAGVAVAASASVPIRYEPVRVAGHRLVDGALSAPVPVDAARALGADFVVAVDVAYRPYEESISGISDVAFQMFHIMVNRLIEEQITRADFSIRLDAHRIMSAENGLSALVDAGEAVVRQRWMELRGRLAEAGIALPGT